MGSSGIWGLAGELDQASKKPGSERLSIKQQLQHPKRPKIRGMAKASNPCSRDPRKPLPMPVPGERAAFPCPFGVPTETLAPGKANHCLPLKLGALARGRRAQRSASSRGGGTIPAHSPHLLVLVLSCPCCPKKASEP